MLMDAGVGGVVGHREGPGVWFSGFTSKGWALEARLATQESEHSRVAKTMKGCEPAVLTPCSEKTVCFYLK